MTPYFFSLVFRLRAESIGKSWAVRIIPAGVSTEGMRDVINGIANSALTKFNSKSMHKADGVIVACNPL